MVDRFNLYKMNIRGHHACEHGKEAEIERRKQADVFCRFAGVVLCIFTEGDQTRKGCNQRAYTADVNTDEKIDIVFRELRQKNGTRHVADDLARHHTEQQGAFFEQCRKDIAHKVDSCHVARKNEEENKGQKQRVVYLFECIAVCKQQHKGNNDQPDPVWNATKYDGNAQGKQHKIQSTSAFGQSIAAVGQLQGFGFYKNKAQHGDKRNRHRKGQCHDAHELTRWDIEFGVQIQVLRVAEGGQHTAQVCGNVLHNKGECHVFFLLRGVQNEVAQRQKCEQCHVVCNEHTADEGDVNESEHTHAGIFEALHNALCKDVEKADVLECAHNGKHTEQACQRFNIEIAEILCIGRDKDACCDCGNKSHNRNRILFEQCGHFFQRQKHVQTALFGDDFYFGLCGNAFCGDLRLGNGLRVRHGKKPLSCW